MSQKQKVIEVYGKKENVKNFDKEREEYSFQRYKHKVEADFLRGAILSISSKNINVLDIGCGTGRMLPEVFKIKKKIQYSGLDTSNKMFKELRKKDIFKKQKKSMSLILSDAAKLPFKDNTFDIVYTYHLLWHLPRKDQERIIKEMLRVTKKGGIIIFDILNKDFIWEKIKKFLKIKKTKGIHKLSLSEVKKIIGNKKYNMEKLNDIHIKNSFLYSVFNIINISRKNFPSSFFHMIYFKIKK